MIDVSLPVFNEPFQFENDVLRKVKGLQRVTTVNSCFYTKITVYNCNVIKNNKIVLHIDNMYFFKIFTDIYKLITNLNISSFILLRELYYLQVYFIRKESCEY